jgi:L-fuconolactonase
MTTWGKDEEGHRLDRAQRELAVVDAHQHFWDPQRVDYPWLESSFPELRRTFGFEDVAPHLRSAGVDATVLVQSADSAADNDAMFEMADRHPEIAGVVAWLPLGQPAQAEATLDGLLHRDRFVGVRALLHVGPDPDLVISEAVGTSLGLLEQASVPFDFAAVVPRHLQNVPVLCERHPGLTIVLDHLSKPPVGAGTLEPWAGLIAVAAQSPNVYAKVSGLYPAGNDKAPWTVEDLRPIVEYAVELFGPERLMFGSDWPVCEVAGGYGAVTDALFAIFEDLDEHERRAVLGGTAVSVYGLEVHQP